MRNLCSVDLVEYLEVMVEKGIGLAIMNLLAHATNNSVRFSTLVALGSMISVHQSEQLALKFKA